MKTSSIQLFDLKGKTDIITGASSGLGEAFIYTLPIRYWCTRDIDCQIEKLNAFIRAEFDCGKSLGAFCWL